MIPQGNQPWRGGDDPHFSLNLSAVMYCFLPDVSKYKGYPLFSYHGAASPKKLWMDKIYIERKTLNAFRNIVKCIYADISKESFTPIKLDQRLAYGISPSALGLRSEGQPNLPFLREGERTVNFKLDSIQSVFEELLNVSGATEWEFLKNTIRELARPDSEARVKKRGELDVEFMWRSYNAEFAWFGHGQPIRISRKEWIETINMSAADLIDKNYGKLCSSNGKPLEKFHLALLVNIVSPVYPDFQAFPSFCRCCKSFNSTIRDTTIISL